MRCEKNIDDFLGDIWRSFRECGGLCYSSALLGTERGTGSFLRYDVGCRFSALLNAAGNRVRKFGVSRVALLVCTQAPSLTAAAIVLISTYRQMNGVGNSAFTGLGETLASAFFRSELVILAVVVSVTVCAVIAAVNSYLKENHSADNDLWR